MPAASPSTPTRVRKWDVVHACDNARQVADVLDAQACANIRAYVVSRPRPANDSLLQSWNEVRKWSTLLADHLGEPPFDSAGLIVHAHSFNAGMAGIRSAQPCVYDLSTFIEQTPSAVTRSWLGRSFRAAEQFVLTQAAAVIVHDSALHDAIAIRGVQSERIFRIPRVAPVMPDFSGAETFRRRLAISLDETVIFSESMDVHLAAVLIAERNQQRRVRLLLTESASAQMALLPQVDQLAQISVSLSRDHHDAAVAASDVVIATSEDALVSAMQHGKPSLAIDGEPTRAVSPDGAGVIWCNGNDPADRARRLSFLLGDRAMRDSLGSSARQFITSARSLERIGRLYEEVYRFAAQQKMGAKSAPPGGTLVPVSANL